ncbi:MAG: hydrogen peroxide-inducible genes activator [Hyphomicrobiaceae bacterium]|nr:hydrogen peroxide-inducible genes activator [Hyphomicrobiaceae bacterium]
MKLSLKQLHYAIALADHGHFGRAAEASHVTQSALSQQIALLEQACRVPVFDRGQRPVVPTPFGREFLARARQLLTEADALETFALSASGLPDRPLRFGLIPTIAPYLLPTIYPALATARPNISLSVVERQTDDLQTELVDGSLDLAMIATDLPADLPLTGESLFADPFVLATPKDLLIADPAPIADLPHDHLLLLEEGHCFRDQALAACGLDRNGRPHPFSATSLSTIVEFVANGQGITLLPAISLRKEASNSRVSIHALAAPGASRTLSLVWRRGSPFETVFRDMATLIREATKDQLAEPISA